MLSYALAIAVAISSLVLFSTAFLMSDIHRQDDFLWSGVGLFYALVLWFCARNITGAVLLGQAAATTLLVSYSWQTLKLRKAIANPEQAAEINNFSLLKATTGLLNRQPIKSQPEIIAPQISSPEKAKVTDETIAIPKAIKTSSSDKNSNKTKSGRLGRFFGKQKNTNITNTKLDEILEEKDTKISKNHDDDDEKSESANMQQVVASSAKEKSEPTQLIEKKVKDTKSSVASEQLTQPVKESVETLQPKKTDSDISTPGVPENEPVVDSASKTSQSLIKEEVQPVTTASETAINKSSVIPESKPQTTSQKVSEVGDSQINKNNSTESNNESQVKKTSANPVETSQLDEKVVKPSVLDSLETVEVAEVLEALPEDAANNRGQEQENIIEVATAEIEEVNIVTEVIKVEHNLDND